jgi:glycine cleavage system H protein
MSYPSELRYTNDHEWSKKEGNRVTVGITGYAYHTLGDIVYLELPEVGSDVNKGDVIGSVESVKAASEIYSPVSGKVVAVNHNAQNSLDVLPQDPYHNGWLITLEVKSDADFKALLSADDYTKYVSTLE